MEKDLIKYGEKVNAMLEVSTEGECPQILKILLIKKMVDWNLEEIKKTGTEEAFKKAEKIIDNFMIGKLMIIKKDEKN